MAITFVDRNYCGISSRCPPGGTFSLLRGLDETDIAPATSPRASGLAPDPVDVMAWIVSWSTLLWMWAGGPLMGVGACLLVYCYCCSGGSGGAKARRRKTTLPL